MPGGTKPPPGRATPLSRGAAPPSEETLPTGATPPPGALPHRHLARPLRGSGQRNEIQSLEGIPPRRGVAPREGAQRLREMDPSKEIRIQKGTPPLKLKLLMKSMLVLLPALMRAADSQLKGSHLPPGRSALSALGVTVRRNRGSPGSQVYTTEEWPPPSHTAKEGMPKELSLPPPVGSARGSSSETGKAGEIEGTKPLRHRRPQTEDCAKPWPATTCLEREKIRRSRDHMRAARERRRRPTASRGH